jgi:hypothetical protein
VGSRTKSSNFGRSPGKLWVTMLSLVELSDVNGRPKVKLDLPQLKVGDPVALRFKVGRVNESGRSEELVVSHRFRVEAVGYDATGTPRQLLTASVASGKPPTWKSVKRAPGRRLGPTRHPRTSI